jgi:hypothetical protein
VTIERTRHRSADAIKNALPLGVRRAVVKARLRARFWTAPLRVLPDFIILGCQRGGTSSLYKYLGRHPHISPSLRKETEFFTVNYGQGERWYRAHFPLRMRVALSEVSKRPRLVFEATPDYLFDPRAPERVREAIPDARLIVLLREPGHRAFSHFRHNVRLGLEPESFERALELEDERIAEDIARLHSHPDDPVYSFRRYSYITRGLYADQVRRWLDAFPRSQLMFLESERFFAEPEFVLRRILQFVGADEWSPSEFRNYTYGPQVEVGSEHPPPDVRAVMDRRFAASNEELRSIVPGEIRWLHGD